jgi:hypothetical protein
MSSVKGEREMLMPPATRIYVQKTWIAAEWIAAGKGNGPPKVDIGSHVLILEALILPYDAKDFKP